MNLFHEMGMRFWFEQAEAEMQRWSSPWFRRHLFPLAIDIACCHHSLIIRRRLINAARGG